MIDLSKAAARSIGMLEPGIAPVAMEVVETLATELPGICAVQVGAFQDIDNAVRFVSEMRARYGVARLVQRDGSPILWRVLVGSKPRRDAQTRLQCGCGRNCPWAQPSWPGSISGPSPTASMPTFRLVASAAG
jgi:hypothetical protein